MKYKVGKIINDDAIETILRNRGLNSDKVEAILNANIKNYESEENYKNIDRAYECLMDCIKNECKISLIVDSDNDGYCSAAILYTFIYNYLEYDDIHYIIRKKNSKSHGLDEEVMDIVLNDGTQLLITPDAGSSDIEQQKILHENGIKFIALDHHEFNSKEVPSYSIVVNNQDGQVKNIHGSGTLVTYKFIRYVAKEEGINIYNDFIDLVNIANIADITNMTSLENRYFYNKGKRVKNMTSSLLSTFAKELKKKKLITIENVAFGITNKINSIIRMGTYEDKCELFEALIDSTEKVEYNPKGRRKQIITLQEKVIKVADKLKREQKSKEDEAMENLKILNNSDDMVMLVDGKNIPSEITGLVANKIINKYHKPVLVLKPKENNYSGSARGYNTVSFKDICEESGLFNWVRGHANAYGFSIKKENIKDFSKYCNEKLKNLDTTTEVIVDYVYEENIDWMDLMELGDLEELWCNDIKAPNLLIRNVIVYAVDIYKKGSTFTFEVGDVLYKKEFSSNIFFDNVIHAENKKRNKKLKMDILCNVKKLEYNGKCYVNIIDIESEVI